VVGGRPKGGETTNQVPGQNRLGRERSRTRQGTRTSERPGSQGCGQGAPAVPMPEGQRPALGVELLPARKRTREWQAAGGRSAQTEADSDSTAMEEEDHEDEETRSLASKR
jgi:hypothetical protein